MSHCILSENLNEFARKELLTMIQQLLMEADLSGELEAFLLSDTSIGGIQVGKMVSISKLHWKNMLQFMANFHQPNLLFIHLIDLRSFHSSR